MLDLTLKGQEATRAGEQTHCGWGGRGWKSGLGSKGCPVRGTLGGQPLDRRHSQGPRRTRRGRKVALSGGGLRIPCPRLPKGALRECAKSPGRSQESKSSPIPTTNGRGWGQVTVVLWPLV